MLCTVKRALMFYTEVRADVVHRLVCADVLRSLCLEFGRLSAVLAAV